MHVPKQFAPPEAFVEPLTIRSYEVTRAGYPQPGEILRYLEYLATRASSALGYSNVWYAEQGTAWLVREMSLLIGWLPPMDSDILMATWIAEFRRVQAFREYAIWHPASGRLIARARARWAYVQRHTGQPLRVPDSMIEKFSAPQMAARLPRVPARSTRAVVLHNRQTIVAREYEADVHQHINNCVYGDWLYEGFSATLRDAGHAVVETRPRFLSLEYLRQVRPGDRVTVQTDVYQEGSRRLRAEQTLVDAANGDMIMRGRTHYLTSANWPSTDNRPED